ncbi:MAG: hypothetical protein K6F96_00430 [Bacteroidales bacterium]|nr:hypothetical protein [Bacteroidales bacterium]
MATHPRHRPIDIASVEAELERLMAEEEELKKEVAQMVEALKKERP